MSKLSEFLEGVIGAVEATSYEKLCLYEEITREGKSWEQGSLGYLETVSHLMNEQSPVCICLLVDIVDGHRILFWHATSMVVDYAAIELWMDQNLPTSAKRPDGNVNRTDPMNFHHIFPRN